MRARASYRPTVDTLPPWLDERLPDRLRPYAVRARPWLSPVAFLCGFVLDTLTLRRVDDVGDNVQLTLYLGLAAVLLVLERRTWHGRMRSAWLRRHHGVLRYGLQVLFGGLFSAYFIFYSRSVTWGPSIAFCLLLVGLMAVNELRFSKFRPDVPLFALFFFSVLSYLLFAVPTWTGQLGWGTRLVAASLALAIGTALVALVHSGPVVDPEPLAAGRTADLRLALVRNGGTWSGMLVTLWVAAWLGLVPPVPLALAEAGIYHDVRRTEEGFALTYDSPPWWAVWRRDDSVFRYRPGDRVHCFSAVFAPSGANLRVLHAWEVYRDGRWQETDRIPWDMRGGRDGGWRSYTAKRHVEPGEWRVRVLSEHGEELGRVRFRVVADAGSAPEQRVRAY